MIYSVNYMDLTEKINPFNFAKYLIDTGWSIYPTKRKKIKIFQLKKDTGKRYQVTIPLDKIFSDYKYVMYEALETTAAAEGKSIKQVLLFLLNPSADILKIRLDRGDIESGNIFFDDAIRIYENTKKLLAATAQDVLHPKKYHQERMDDSVSDFINNCKFGQTEIGSYIVPVICPFGELDEDEEYKQLSMFSEEERCATSLTRNVTNRVIENISFIKHSIENGEYEKLSSDKAPHTISANFYEALMGLDLDNQETTVEFIAQWSPSVKKNRCRIDRISITHDYYQPINDAVEKMRKNVNRKTKIIGKVKKLESVPDISQRTSGKATIVYLDKNNMKRTISSNLDKENYNKAIKAHSLGSYVEIVGDIRNTGKRNVSIQCETFDVVN